MKKRQKTITDQILSDNTMAHSILIIDDDPSIHEYLDAFLTPEFETHHAETAQEGIDILSRETINLMLVDVHLPGVSGLEFLESLKQDKEKAAIPSMIMTVLPTSNKKDKALDLDAADFLPKDPAFFEPERLLRSVRDKIQANIKRSHLSEDYLDRRKQKLVARFVIHALTQDFETTMTSVCNELITQFNLNMCLFCLFTEAQPVRIGDFVKDVEFPSDYTDQDLAGEQRLMEIKETQKGYMTNYATDAKSGIMAAFSQSNNLPAEIAIPIYQLEESDFLLNRIGAGEPALFAVVVLKRNALFSTEEFDTIRTVVQHMGPILWRLYSRENR